MKIAFINDSAQQLGIQYMSAVLKQHGHDVRLFMDPQLFADDVIQIKRLNRLLDMRKDIVRRVKDYAPDLVGISVVTDFYQWASQIARMIKDEMDVPIIAGGIHPTSVPERVLQDECFDMVCLGEGEFPLLELADSMQRGKMDTSIPNIWFKENGRIIKNELRPLLEDLDALPLPDTDLYYSVSPHFRRTGLYITMTSRGCPNACSYCCFSYLQDLYKGKGKRIRQRSVQNVIEELRINKAKYKIKFIAFMDNCFGYDVKWLREFTPVYRSEIGIKFWCIMHPKDVTEETLRHLKQAGCHTIDMGVQSWNEDIRKEVLHRDVDNDTMARAIQIVKDAGIEIMTDSIFDLPGQTEEDVLESARRYVEIRPKRIYFYMLRHYPNTLITRLAKQDQRLAPARYEEVMSGVNVTSFTVGGDQVNQRMIQFQILFYLIDLIPKSISRYIIRKRLYRYFPVALGPAIIVILRNLLAFDMNARLQRAWAFNRYAYFIWQKLKPLKK